MMSAISPPPMYMTSPFSGTSSRIPRAPGPESSAFRVSLRAVRASPWPGARAEGDELTARAIHLLAHYAPASYRATPSV